jgi:hypothetical protein
VIVLSFRANMGQEDKNWAVCWPASRQVERWVNEAYPDYATKRPAMPRMTRLPKEVACLFAPLKPHFRYRHYVVLCWLIVAHLVCFEKATLQALARHTSTRVAAWHLRRLLAAGYWPWTMVAGLVGGANLGGVSPAPRRGPVPGCR